MPDCVPVRLARAVATEINAATLSVSFTAAFSFASEITEFQDLNADTLTVDVVPTSDQQVAYQAGSMIKHKCRVALGIRRRIAPADRTDAGAVDADAVTAYVNLLYKIFALFAAGRNLTDEPLAVWDIGEQAAIKLYDPDLLKDGLFFGWIHLPFIVAERQT